MKKVIGIVMVVLSLVSTSFSQDRFVKIEKDLKELSLKTPGLNQEVELSVSGVSIEEFVRGIGSAHQLNISIDNTINARISNNFANAKVSDVLLFLCKQYSLDIEFIGTIISLKKYQAPIEPPQPVATKLPEVKYNSANDFLSLDLKKDSLDRIAEEITKQTAKNVIISPELEGKLISVFIQNRPFENALDKMALANGLKLTKTADNFFYLERGDAVEEEEQANNRNYTRGRGSNTSKNTGAKKGANFSIQSKENGTITVDATEIAIADIIEGVSRELFKNYFLFKKPEGTTSLYIENATYEQFLEYVLNGTSYTFKNQDDVYLIGQRNLESLRLTELVALENRTIENVLTAIPAELKKDVDIKEFTELNALILSGSSPNIREIKSFLAQVDRVVPVVIIEVLIADVTKSKSISTGIKAGIDPSPTSATKTTSGQILGTTNVNLNSSSINKLIDSFNGFGVLNLGKVTPDFYLSLNLLENQGIVKLKSTPKLATLNGHEASLTIGNTEYYLETQNTISGSLNPQSVLTQNYKSVNADLSINIKPFVSADGQVTLEIEVNQSDFTARISAQAPPGSVTRNFKSTIRVEDGEMILMGGLEEKNYRDNTSGVPFLSRIPIIKWFFTDKTREKSKSKLTVFIKPTVIY